MRAFTVPEQHVLIVESVPQTPVNACLETINLCSPESTAVTVTPSQLQSSPMPHPVNPAERNIRPKLLLTMYGPSDPETTPFKVADSPYCRETLREKNRRTTESADKENTPVILKKRLFDEHC